MKRSATDSSKYYNILKEIDAKVHAIVTAPPEEITPKEASASAVNGNTANAEAGDSKA